MLSVAETIPATVIEAIGAAKTVGRDRWEELKKQVKHTESADFAKQVVLSNEFHSKDAADRFNYLVCPIEGCAKKAAKGGSAESRIRVLGSGRQNGRGEFPKHRKNIHPLA